MNNNMKDEFVELTTDEISHVDGGAGCLVVVAVVGLLALAAYIGYQDDHRDQNREDKK